MAEKRSKVTRIISSHTYDPLFPVNLLYYLIFFAFFNFHFMKTTMFYREHFFEYEEIFNINYDRLTDVLFYLSIFTIIFVIKELRMKLFSAAILILMVIFNTNREVTTYKTIMVFFLLVICSYGKSYKGIGWSAVISGWFWIIISYIGTRTGYITDIIYRPGARHSFGSIYTTDLACHFLTLTMAVLILRKGRLKIWEYAFIFLQLAVNLVFMKAKVTLVCMMLLTVVTLYYQYIHPKARMNPAVKKNFLRVCVVSFFLFAALMLYFTWDYSSSPEHLYNRTHALKTMQQRFMYGREAMDRYPINMWGTYFNEQGWGGSQDGTIDFANYFFLDISYVKILFKYGISIWLTSLIVFLVAQVRLYRARQYYLMFILMVFALDCAVEHHMIEIAYSLCAYLAFCNISKKEDQIPNSSTVLLAPSSRENTALQPSP